MVAETGSELTMKPTSTGMVWTGAGGLIIPMEWVFTKHQLPAGLHLLMTGNHLVQKQRYCQSVSQLSENFNLHV